MYVFAASLYLLLQSRSLKTKRGIVKSILARARNTFNVSAAEVDLQDLHGEAVLGFVAVSENRVTARKTLEQLEEWLVEERPDVEVVSADIEER
ncbi:MAG: DUF503 domain-containing protein [Geobacter sp.]|nr:MAG: DUF503 domain-containing protein [Geobacter sp.]